METELKKRLDHAHALWQRVLGEDLEQMYLYGSAARGQWQERVSDINLLFLLRSGHGLGAWPELAGTIKRQAKKGFATPLFLTSAYIQSSLDVYPIEFLDMKLFHRVLHGEDSLSDLVLAPVHLRTQCEREVKGKWVQLRQAALEVGGDNREMRELLVASMSSWVSILQALLYLHGQEIPAEKQLVIERGCELAGLDASVFHDIARLKAKRSGRNRSGTWQLVVELIRQIDVLARFVDQWEPLPGEGDEDSRQG